MEKMEMGALMRLIEVHVSHPVWGMWCNWRSGPVLSDSWGCRTWPSWPKWPGSRQWLIAGPWSQKTLAFFRTCYRMFNNRGCEYLWVKVWLITCCLHVYNIISDHWFIIMTLITFKLSKSGVLLTYILDFVSISVTLFSLLPRSCLLRPLGGVGDLTLEAT